MITGTANIATKYIYKLVTKHAVQKFKLKGWTVWLYFNFTTLQTT